MMVCIEGIDAAGKGTQSKILAEKLNAKLFTFPNYESLTGKLIRSHLLEAWRAVPTPQAPSTMAEGEARITDALVFQALQLANRMESAEEIKKAKAQGNVVLDRYWPSGYVYGGMDGLDPEYLLNLHRHLTQPDVFILIDVDPELSVVRRPERRDRYEKQAGAMQEAAERYRQLWRQGHTGLGQHWVTVNGNGSLDEVTELIWQFVLRYLEF